jgi:hypothetical protein
MISWAITRPNSPGAGLWRLQRVWAEHGHQAGAELHPDLGLLAGGKHIHHPVHGLGGGTGVQGAEHQVAGFGGGDRQLNGFQIAHFPHQDHVRIFPQGCPQGIGKAAGVIVAAGAGAPRSSQSDR